MLYITFQTDDPTEALSILSHIKKETPPPPSPLALKLLDPVESPLTPTGERLKKQGQYAGLVRHLSPKDKKLVKSIYQSEGIDAAIRVAGSVKTPFFKVTDGGRHRAKCSYCRRGYLAKRKDSHYCSKRCRDAGYRREHSLKAAL